MESQRPQPIRLAGRGLLGWLAAPLEPGTVPDGVALDTEANIYAAYCSPDRIGVITRND